MNSRTGSHDFGEQKERGIIRDRCAPQRGAFSRAVERENEKVENETRVTRGCADCALARIVDPTHRWRRVSRSSWFYFVVSCPERC